MNHRHTRSQGSDDLTPFDPDIERTERRIRSERRRRAPTPPPSPLFETETPDDSSTTSSHASIVSPMALAPPGGFPDPINNDNNNMGLGFNNENDNNINNNNNNNMNGNAVPLNGLPYNVPPFAAGGQ